MSGYYDRPTETCPEHGDYTPVEPEPSCPRCDWDPRYHDTRESPEAGTDS